MRLYEVCMYMLAIELMSATLYVVCNRMCCKKSINFHIEKCYLLFHLLRKIPFRNKIEHWLLWCHILNSAVVFFSIKSKMLFSIKS